jgi:nicotinamide-nucleotide amidase
MRVEVVAVGTELLLGQIADTNSAWLGDQMAAAGVTSYFHQAVGDNQARIVLALRTALARSDGVIVCGGLGPTQDDITREAIAEVMNVPLQRDPVVVDRIAQFFSARGRPMSENNARQGDVPGGASVIEQTRGTAPGLICPIGNKVLYAVPGVPHEMADMFERAILPDLRRRLAEAGEEAVILSRILRTWGTSESALAEVLADRIEALDAPSADGSRAAGAVTIAFLASGMEGLKVRLTARAPTADAAKVLLDVEETEVRAVLQRAFGDVVFGLDDESMEHVVARLLIEHGLSLGVAESLTGGLLSARLVDVEGASAWFRGAIVSYSPEVKQSILGVAPGPVVTAEVATTMAEGARRVLGADVGLGITGVAGPDEEDGQPVGTVFTALVMPGSQTLVTDLHLPGDRPRVRQYTVISVLDLLRRALLHPEGADGLRRQEAGAVRRW